MNAIIAVANLVFLFLVAYQLWTGESTLRKVYWPALLLKLFAGIALGLLYSYYYPAGDTFIFFQDGKTLTEWARNNPGNYIRFLWSGDESFSIWKALHIHQPRALFLSKIVSLLNFVTGNNYWITSLYFSLVSFSCSWRLVRELIYYFPRAKQAAVVSFLFIPSVLFWSSGLIKESLAMAALFFLAGVFLRILKNDRIKLTDWFLTVFFYWILWELKYYYAAVFIAIMATTLMASFIFLPLLKLKKQVWKIALWFMVFAVPLFFISLAVENFHWQNFFEVVVKNYNIFQHLSSPEGVIHFYNLQPNGWSLLINAPWALCSGLFRPFVWETKNIFQLAASLENMVLLFLFIPALRKWKAILQSPDLLLILSVVVYVGLLCIFLALSTPNFGTLSRYRIGFLPFLFYMLLYDNVQIRYLSTFVQRSFSHLVREC